MDNRSDMQAVLADIYDTSPKIKIGKININSEEGAAYLKRVEIYLQKFNHDPDMKKLLQMEFSDLIELKARMQPVNGKPAQVVEISELNKYDTLVKQFKDSLPAKWTENLENRKKDGKFEAYNQLMTALDTARVRVAKQELTALQALGPGEEVRSKISLLMLESSKKGSVTLSLFGRKSEMGTALVTFVDKINQAIKSSRGNQDKENVSQEGPRR